jgi:RNA polymerase sigma factor (sigma-70 family)
VRLSPSIALLRTQSDERLVKLAREGSDVAFATIVERHRRAVLAACRRILPEARAEDAAQQVYMAAWKALARGDDVRDVRAWLLRIARNTSLNALRVQGFDYDELRDGLRVGPAADEVLERRDVIRHTLAGLASLPDRQREVLLRSAVEGVAHADIARDLGLSEGATRQLMLRARTTLRAAASAVTPWPLVAWAAQAGGGAAAAGGTGALAAKVGAAAVLAGGVAVGTPAIVHHERETSRRAPVVPAAVVAAPAAAEDVASVEEAGPASVAPRRSVAPAPKRRASRPAPESGTRHEDRSGPRHDGEDRSGPSGEDERHETTSGDGDDHSGPSGGDDDTTTDSSGSGSGSSGSDDDGLDSSGSGSDSGESDDGGSNSGSSESSGSGSGTSGSSGSGSDDLRSDDSSGSGSSGSGSDDEIEPGA